MDRARAAVYLRRALLNIILFLILFVCAAAPSRVRGVGIEFLPPEHWSYAALERFESLGFCTLPSEKPFTRHEVVGYVKTIHDEIAATGRSLSARDRFNLQRLDHEFASSAAQGDPASRYDQPVWYAGDPPFSIEGDFDVAVEPRKDPYDDRWDFFGIARPSTRLHLFDSMTYEVRYILTMGPERGNRVRDAKPSPREKSFKGLTSVFERSYVVYRWKQATLFLGRDYVDWGPSDNGNLIVSETAGSLNKLGARLDFKYLRFSFFHANLSPRAERYLSAHRLEIPLGRLRLGISETVVHLDVLIDPLYALPFGSFYANQFNEGGDDNILWAVDLKYPITDGLIVSSSFLIDDFQFERGDNQPDKIAFDVGLRGALGGAFPLEVLIAYRYVDIYTYSHEDTLKSYVAGDANLPLGDPILGAEQGPDSDLLRATAAFFPRPDVTATLYFSMGRRGEGNDLRGFAAGDDPFPTFPSGIVEETLGFGAKVQWEFGGNSAIRVDGLRTRVKDRDHLSVGKEWSSGVRMQLLWNL